MESELLLNTCSFQEQYGVVCAIATTLIAESSAFQSVNESDRGRDSSATVDTFQKTIAERLV